MSKIKRPEVGDVVQVQAGWARGQRGTVLVVEGVKEFANVTVRLFGDFPAEGTFPVQDLFVLPEGAPEPRRDVE